MSNMNETNNIFSNIFSITLIASSTSKLYLVPVVN